MPPPGVHRAPEDLEMPWRQHPALPSHRPDRHLLGAGSGVYILWEGMGGGAARSGSSPFSCASSGRPEEWFHQGESMFVLLSRPGGCSEHQGGAPHPIVQAGISMTTAGRSSLRALAHPQSLSRAAISMTTVWT